MTKSLVVLILVVTALHLSAQVPAPGTKPKPTAPAKITPHDIHAFPFAQEHKDVKFKANSREFANELTVVVGDKIHFYGKRRSEGSPGVRGKPTGHIGQVVLFPAGDHQGTLALKKAFGTTLFFSVLELPDDTLSSKQMQLKEGKIYTWTSKTENGTITMHVLAPDGTEVGTNSAPSDKALSFGFAGTVRNQGNEIDMTISYE